VRNEIISLMLLAFVVLPIACAVLLSWLQPQRRRPSPFKMDKDQYDWMKNPGPADSETPMWETPAENNVYLFVPRPKQANAHRDH
jgi:hypothetical protein